jgi:hypothetical protein
MCCLGCVLRILIAPYSILYFLYVPSYLIFSDLPICPTYALLHSTRVSLYVPDVSYLPHFGVMLIKLLILFVVSCAIFMFVYSDS